MIALRVLAAGAVCLASTTFARDCHHRLPPATRREAAESLLRSIEQRRVRGRPDGQRQLVKFGQIVKVVRRDRTARQLVKADHQRPFRDLRVVGPFHQADAGLAAAEFVGQLALRHVLVDAPLGQSHPKPPGTGALCDDYCHSLYFSAIDKRMMGAEYKGTSSNVLVMHPGNRLRALRKDKGLTQSDLAELTGVSQPAISQIENGVLAMDIPWMRAFARVLGVTAADLLEDVDNPDRLDADERALLARYRAADRAQRQTLERVAAAVVPDVEAAGDDAQTAA